MPISVADVAYLSYLAIIHPTFPLLASSREKVQLDLVQCPFMLREAFLEALYSLLVLMQTSQPREGDTRQAHHFLMSWRASAMERSPTIDRVLLQTLLLMIIEVDNAGPSAVKDEMEGPSKSELLAWAVAHAYRMKLHRLQVDSNAQSEMDADADHMIAIRSWWSLIMLDRWNAIGSGDPLMIHNETVVVLPGLRALFGEAGYEMIRTCLRHHAQDLLTNLCRPHSCFGAPDPGFPRWS